MNGTWTTHTNWWKENRRDNFKRITKILTRGKEREERSKKYTNNRKDWTDLLFWNRVQNCEWINILKCCHFQFCPCFAINHVPSFTQESKRMKKKKIIYNYGHEVLFLSESLSILFASKDSQENSLGKDVFLLSFTFRTTVCATDKYMKL